MKKILGLDLGTNSIGWAIVEKGDNEGHIVKSGSRIIPMDAAVLSDFAKGNTKSQTAERTSYRGTRRLRERFLLRRERLHRVLKVLNFLPKHYLDSISWDNDNDKKHFGSFIDDKEVKIAWRKNENGKFEFIFQDSFNEMLNDFKKNHSELKKIPYDWTLYYLRKKALTSAISREELSWIILNFNQKRGYNQLRDEILEVQDNKKSEYFHLKVKNVIPDNEAKGNDRWYTIEFENSDIIYRRKSKYPLDWVGKYRDIIVTTTFDNNGNPKLNKDGGVAYSVKSPNEDDWGLLKIKTEQDLNLSNKTIGDYIYSTLLKNPNQKIKGGLIRTIERDYYKQELVKILQNQVKYHPELTNSELYNKCIKDLYPNNETHRNNISKKDFTFLIMEDVLYYQRPLKSKKHLIDNCPYEFHKGIDKKTGEVINYYLKCIAKSNPYYQEFRIWQFISNLRIIANSYEIDKHIISDYDVTSQFINTVDDKYNLFKWLNEQKAVNQKKLLSYFGIKGGMYRWNYVEDKEYPMNATHYAIYSKLNKGESISRDLEQELWNLLYSISSKKEIDKSLSPKTKKQNTIYLRLKDAGISEESIEKLKTVKLPDEGYGAYSEKAIRKLLPLMRIGCLWQENNIDNKTIERIKSFMNGNNINNYSEKVWNTILKLNNIQSYQGLPEWLACYIVYGKHSEPSEIVKWKTPHDIDVFLNNFKQHSLHNPIVENVILETLRVVRDLLAKYGKFDEIHLEMGRELKNPSDKRAQITSQILANENTNTRIKYLLAEMSNKDFNVENVRPYSPSQQELLKIYEGDVLSQYEPEKEIQGIIKELSNPTEQPSHSKILKYKCWLDQKYCSPYTGQPIPLSKLFTSEYEIEHIIPQSRYFDDSFSNKVICESNVNKLKDNMLGYEFIKKYHGYTLDDGKRILEVDSYELLINKTYSSNTSKLKRKKLLMDDIPSEFIERQLNDTRYISKYIKGLLSNLVREEDNEGSIEKEATSKNLIVCNGNVTSRLKREWGLADVWNKIVLPRFKRLNTLQQTTCFTKYTVHGNEIPTVPLELQKGFSVKRIDHRHHALDAIVIACTTRDHVNLLNNEYSKPENKDMKYALSHKLRRYENEIINGKERSVPKEFLMPWSTFKKDCFESIEQIIVSFKQNLRILNSATNIITKAHNNTERQNNDNHFAIRKPLHKDTIYGHVNLRKIKEVKLSKALDDINGIVDKKLKNRIKSLIRKKYSNKQILEYFKHNSHEWKDYNFDKIKVYFFTDEKELLVATRYGNDLVSIFAGKKNKKDIEKIISQISDTGIQKILLNYLNENVDNIEYAFSPDGLETMNDSIVLYNNGVQHKPIYKVRMVETMGLKFPVGTKGNKISKYVEAAKGTNLYFAVYKDEEGNASFTTIPLNEVVERLKQKLIPVPEVDEQGSRLAFYISPGDLVYMPKEGETYDNIDKIDPNRIYKFLSSTRYQAFFVPAFISSPITQTLELGSNNKSEREWSETGWGELLIKNGCIPLVINRIGEIRIK